MAYITRRNPLLVSLLIVLLVSSSLPLSGRTPAGDKMLAEGRAFESKKDWDSALDSYRKALAEDAGDVLYRMSSDKARFQAAQAHLEHARKIRSQGRLEEALAEFRLAQTVDPASAAAEQEVRITQDMLASHASGTPVEEARQRTRDAVARLLPRTRA